MVWIQREFTQGAVPQDRNGYDHGKNRSHQSKGQWFFFMDITE